MINLFFEHLKIPDTVIQIGTLTNSINASNNFDFKKFVEDLEKRQQEQLDKKKKLQQEEKQWPARELNKKYRETPDNRTNWGK